AGGRPARPAQEPRFKMLSRERLRPRGWGRRGCTLSFKAVPVNNPKRRPTNLSYKTPRGRTIAQTPCDERLLMRSKKEARRPVRRKETAPGMALPPGDGPADVGPTGRALMLSGRDGQDAAPPDMIPLLPLRTDVVFPQTVVPLIVNRPGGIRLIDEVL